MSSAQRPLLGHPLDLTPLPRRKRPSYFLRVALFSSVVIIVSLAFLQPEQRSKAYSRLSALQGSSASSLAAAKAAPAYSQSCEVCHVDPTNPLCQYGEHNIRLSRAFEGSGYRLQRFLRKMVAGEEVQVGVLGASITQGHSVLPNEQTWQVAWFEDLQKEYPNVKMHVGAVGATDSQFFSYCFPALLPVNDIDLFLVELDINNEPGLKTLKDDDALMRGLLQLPQEPAVVRVSFFATIFPEQGRGTLSTLTTSQFFDIPVISIRNFLLPQVIKYRDSAEVIFGLDQWGNRDYRHVSALSHRAMADMLTLFLKKEICEVKRQELLRSVRKLPMTGPWWKEEDLGSVPDITLYESWMKPLPPRVVSPLCHSTVIPRSPLVPVSYSKAFELVEWNGKSAWISSEPGSQIRLRFTGSKVGVFVYSMPGPVTGHATAKKSDKEKEEAAREAPGMAYCWVEEPGQYERELEEEKARSPKDRLTAKQRIKYAVNTHEPSKAASGTTFTELAEDLAPGKEHILACEVTNETTSGGHKWRLQAIASL